MKRLRILSLMIPIVALFVSGCMPTFGPASNAILQRNTPALKKELDAGLSPHHVIPDSELMKGYSLMDLAIMYNSPEAIDLLAERGADVKKSVVHFNIAYQPPEQVLPTVNTLLKYQVDPTELLGGSCGQPSIIKLLLEKGAKINGQEGSVPPLSTCINLFTTYNGYIKTLPHHADTYTPIRDRALESTYLLIQNGANVNAAKMKGKSIPLELAIISGNLPLVETILKKGGEVNHVDENGVTPLMHATSRNLVDITKLLLAHGADTSPKDKTGLSAADWAMKYNFTATYNLVNNAPAQQPTPIQAQKASDELQAILKSKNSERLRSYLDAHPDQIHAISDPATQLLYTGPKELRIADIIELSKMKKKDAIIMAKINATGGPYKDFSMKEMTQLERMGLSDDVVAAMITVTTQHQQKQAALTQAQPIKQQTAQQAIAQPIKQQPVQPAAQPQQSTIGDAVVESVAKEVGSRLIRQFLPF